MRVAHLIMVHKEPAQLERLIMAMNHSNFDIYIHIDLKTEINEFSYLSGLPRVKFIVNRALCNWGGFSFMNAILTSMDEILSSDEEYGFINLMSGQDYPIKSTNEIYAFLSSNQDKCFISFDTDHHKKWWKHATKRTELYHFTDQNFKGRYWIQKLMNTYLPKRVFPLSSQLYGSSNSSWWTITSGCAKYIVDFMRLNTQLKRFMKYTWGSDEFLIATIIMNSKYAEQVINNNLRLITWPEGLASPHILTINDFSMIKASEDNFFARKFDVNIDQTILNQIDELIKS